MVGLVPGLIPPPYAKTPGVAAISQPRGRCGRFYVRRFLRMGLTEPLLRPKTTMEMRVHRVHGRTDTARVSPAPLTSTQRHHGHIDRVGRGVRSRETTPHASAPATTVSTLLHGACVHRVGRGGGLAGATVPS